MTVGERPLRKDAERNRQRILEAARELFTRRGLAVTLNEIAHHAGVGVGTVYRRFPDREKLIEALFEERLEQIGELLETARAEPDPWRALTRFYERALELQAADRGLRELLLGAPGAPERLTHLRARLEPLAAALVERARAAGDLRADCEPEDLGVVHLMLSAVIDAGHDVSPELWRRYFAIVLQGLRAKPEPPEPLPVPPVSPKQMDDVLLGAWKRRRA
jgi:AcrR family transcriptional regulator